jgi:hypothetical protein
MSSRDVSRVRLRKAFEAVRQESHTHAEELSINTTGFVQCPIPGCGWKVLPATLCPEHNVTVGGLIQ